MEISDHICREARKRRTLQIVIKSDTNYIVIPKSILCYPSYLMISTSHEYMVFPLIAIIRHGIRAKRPSCLVAMSQKTPSEKDTKSGL